MSQSINLEQERWGVIKEYILFCFPPSETDKARASELEETAQKLGLAFPQILKDWFLFCGGPGLDIPSILPEMKEYFLISHEAQWVVVWAIRRADLHLTDPPVFLDTTFAEATRREEHQWLLENQKLSEFVIQMGLYTTMIASRFCGGGPATAEEMAQVERHFPSLGLPDWHWPKYPTRFFGANDTYIAVDGSGWVWVSAASEELLEQAVDLIGVDLESP